MRQNKIISFPKSKEDKKTVEEVYNYCLELSEEEGWFEEDFNHNFGWYKKLFHVDENEEELK